MTWSCADPKNLTMGTVYGTKVKNKFWNNSFGAKNEYNSNELDKIIDNSNVDSDKMESYKRQKEKIENNQPEQSRGFGL
jgi:hypothetical protein